VPPVSNLLAFSAGARRTLAGYPAGTHWIRAASVRASAQSVFTSPVSVIVK